MLDDDDASVSRTQVILATGPLTDEHESIADVASNLTSISDAFSREHEAGRDEKPNCSSNELLVVNTIVSAS